MYLFQGEPTGKKGRPKCFDGKIDSSNLDYSKFEKLESDEDNHYYSAIVYAKALAMKVRVVIAVSRKTKKHKIYFSTDTTQEAVDILELYRTRFQIEFNFRDVKQCIGLTNS